MTLDQHVGIMPDLILSKTFLGKASKRFSQRVVKHPHLFMYYVYDKSTRVCPLKASWSKNSKNLFPRETHTRVPMCAHHEYEYMYSVLGGSPLRCMYFCSSCVPIGQTLKVQKCPDLGQHWGISTSRHGPKLRREKPNLASLPRWQIRYFPNRGLRTSLLWFHFKIPAAIYAVFCRTGGSRLIPTCTLIDNTSI